MCLITECIFIATFNHHFVFKTYCACTYQVRNKLQYSKSFEDVVLNILVVGCIQECNISNLIRWMFLPVFFLLYKEWTVWIVSDFWVWHDMISSKWTPKIFVLFSRSTGSLLCINLHLSDWLRLCLLLSCIDENSRYFVLSSLKTKLFCKAQSDTVCRFDSNFSIQFCRFFNL